MASKNVSHLLRQSHHLVTKPFLVDKLLPKATLHLFNSSLVL